MSMGVVDTRAPRRVIWPRWRRVRRVLRTALIALVILVLVVAGLGVWFSREAWPQHTGTLRLPDLSAPVEVIRDAQGVVHIYADTPADLFAAQGFVHAQERFFQMEFSRRVGQGRLSELLGRVTLQQDKFIRTLGWNRAAKLDLAAVSPESLRMLEAYAGGVNAYILPLADQPAKLGLEFRVLGLTGKNVAIEPWVPLNTVSWSKVMAWDLRGDALDNELLNISLLNNGGEPLLHALRPDYPADMPLVVSPTIRIGNKTQSNLFTSHGNKDASGVGLADQLLGYTSQLDQMLGHLPNNGSNTWVVSGIRTHSGKPLLANDPHLGIQMPSVWFQIGLHCRIVSAACPYDVSGVSIAGVPGIVIGHNSRIAWGISNLGPDAQDLFTERPNAANPNEFEYRGQWEAATIHEERIEIAGEMAETITVRETRHGPILNAVSNSLRESPPTALKWTALQASHFVDGILALNRAQNFQDFRSALKGWESPAQNVVYADVDGNIGYQMTGSIPVRARGYGDVPSDGWTGEQEWVGTVPFDELPWLYNPPEGRIVSANNAVIAPASTPFIGNDFDQGFRARRIQQLLDSQSNLDVAAFLRIQIDNESGLAQDILPTLKPLLTTATGTAPGTSQRALQLLNAWDGQSTVDSAGALIWETFWFRLAHAIFDDEVGTNLARYAVTMNSATRSAVRNQVTNLEGPDATFWDDTTTPARETPAEIVKRAWDETIETLSARLGSDAAQWRWGRAHTATFRHGTFGQSGIALLDRVFNRGPIAVNGTTDAINANAQNESMNVLSIPSLRMVMDLAQPDNDRIINSTGQSGHPFHANYADMVQAWADGDTLPFWHTNAAVRAHQQDVLMLVP